MLMKLITEGCMVILMPPMKTPLWLNVIVLSAIHVRVADVINVLVSVQDAKRKIILMKLNGRLLD